MDVAGGGIEVFGDEAAALGLGEGGSIGGDVGALAAACFEEAVSFEVAIDAGDGVGVDEEAGGQLADGGELVARDEEAGGDGAADLVADLAVDGDG